MTVQESLGPSVAIHVIDLPSQKNTSIQIKPQGASYWEEYKVDFTPLSESQQKIATLVLSNLPYNTKYECVIDGKSYWFTTINPHKYRLVVGGDIELNSTLHTVNEQVARYNPDVAIICGDIGYSHKRGHWIPGYRTRYPENLIAFLRIWDMTIQQKTKRLVPLICAIGNHDVHGMFGKEPKDAALFYDLFIPKDQKSYRMIDAPMTPLLILDSGHTASIQGKQTEFIHSVLSTLPRGKKPLVFYHVAAYPSTRASSRYSRKIRSHWVPLFEKYQVGWIFEHHDHGLKRTHPIRNHKKDKEGLVFLGDGAWSASTRRAKKRWYVEKRATTNGFWVVDVDQDQIEARAIDLHGKVIDKVYMTISVADSSEEASSSGE